MNSVTIPTMIDWMFMDDLERTAWGAAFATAFPLGIEVAARKADQCVVGIRGRRPSAIRLRTRLRVQRVSALISSAMPSGFGMRPNGTCSMAMADTGRRSRRTRSTLPIRCTCGDDQTSIEVGLAVEATYIRLLSTAVWRHAGSGSGTRRRLATLTMHLPAARRRLLPWSEAPLESRYNRFCI